MAENPDQSADYERLRWDVSDAVNGAISGWTASETWEARIRAVDEAVDRIIRLIDDAAEERIVMQHSDGTEDDGLCADETPCGNCSRPDPFERRDQ